ncbi:MAG TPA: AMP-binding protein [Acidimicrobiales bacterium]|nr:AMP-binding protein [Acidimicrobiales bacterium]
MQLHFATVWETISDLHPDVDAVVQGERRLSYREFDELAARFAAAVGGAGLGPDSKVALYLYNSPEYLVAQYGAFKARAAAINVNYRYVDDELAYLLADSDSEVLVFHTSLADRVARVADRLPLLRLLVEVDDGGGVHLDGAVPMEKLLADHDPAPRVERGGDDLYMLYTGGTTGMPKGVMYHQHDFVKGMYANFALLGLPVAPPASIEEIPDFVAAMDQLPRLVSIPCPPLMHGTGMWVGAMPALVAGGTVVLLESRTFDPSELWRVAERERATRVVVVGDAFARPMLRALEQMESEGRACDLSSVDSIASSGAMWSAEVKDGLAARLDAVMIDALGSTEGGGYGVTSASRTAKVDTARFSLVPGTRVITADGRDVEPGSDEQGLLATQTGAYGYYKDPEKTARTFRELDGAWYVLTGDWATVDADGSIRLLGRGSNCINSGGEKIYPEEVEEALKRHEAVDDCLVVGLPHERFGQQVVAVAGCGRPERPGGDELRAWLRSSLSGYKIPKHIVVVDAVRRAPNGKADYGWARQVASEAAPATAG